MERHSSGLINDAPEEIQSFVGAAEDACYFCCPREASIEFWSDGVAETIDWAAAVFRLGANSIDEHLAAVTLGTVVKYREDERRVIEHGLDEVVAAAVRRAGADAATLFDPPLPPPAADE